MADGKTLTMQTREEPRFVRFSTGDVIEGVLVKMERLNIRDKQTSQLSQAVRYTVSQDDGTDVAFIGTHQIDSKLRPDDRGHKVEIRCVGEDVTVKRGENFMKVFEVRVSKELASSASIPTVDSIEITDADILF